MTRTADGGGGGAVDLRMDPGEVRAVASKLGKAASALDAVGSATPGTADHGLAGVLLATMVARVCETGGRLALEAQTLSETVTACHDTTVATDQAAAERFLISGTAGE